MIKSGLVLLASLLPFASIAAVVSKITIEGNVKTQPEIIQQEMELISGSDLSDVNLENSRQAIMDLGLFEEVEISVVQQQGQSEVVVNVKEKRHDWYVLPRLDRNGDGDIKLGVNWRETNLFGLNQTSRFTLSQKQFKDASKDKETRLKWSFRYPRIINTRLSSYAFINLSQSGLKEERDGFIGFYDREEYSAGFGLGRWFVDSGASKGYQADLGFELNHFDHEYLRGEQGFFDDATVLSLIANVRYSKVKDVLYSRDGHAMGIRFQKSSKAWGSDRNFFFQELYFRRYFALGFREHTNFNFQVQAARGDRSIFGDPIYELSGGHTLRGYPRETLEGDAYFLVNTEFLTPLFGKQNLRGAVLFDAGNAYQNVGDFTHTDLEYGVGIGLRWKFKQWVNTELRIDYARGLGDEGTSRLYVASEATF